MCVVLEVCREAGLGRLGVGDEGLESWREGVLYRQMRVRELRVSVNACEYITGRHWD